MSNGKQRLRPDPAEGGWVFFDGECGFCRRWVSRIEKPLRKRGYRFSPLQEGWVARRIGLPPEELLRELRCLTPDGRLLGGGEAIRHLLCRIPWLAPVGWLSGFPLLRQVFDAVYRLVAEGRHCAFGSRGRTE